MSFQNRVLVRNLTEVLDQTTRAIETADHSGVSQALTTHQRLLGGTTLVNALSEVLLGRLSSELSHAETSSRLTDLAEALPSTLPPEVVAVWEDLCQAFGCFVASHSFGAKRLRLQSEAVSKEQRFLAAVEQGRLDQAIDSWESTSRSTRTKDFWADAGHYLWLWSGGSTGASKFLPPDSWTSFLAGRQVVVLGPAPTSLSAEDLPADALVARVIAPGVISWPKTDAGRGRCDLAYANSKSTKWFIEQGDSSVFGRFSWSSFRTDKWRALRISQARTALHHKRLLPMPWDKTNMVPLAVWDLLHVPDVDIAVAGTTFFASRTAYTPHDVRFNQERGQATDQTGSTGIRFERCLSFSHHALPAHLALIANLSSAGVVGFDVEGKQALELSRVDYLATLDRYYGEPEL